MPNGVQLGEREVLGKMAFTKSGHHALSLQSKSLRKVPVVYLSPSSKPQCLDSCLNLTARCREHIRRFYASRTQCTGSGPMYIKVYRWTISGRSISQSYNVIMIGACVLHPIKHRNDSQFHCQYSMKRGQIDKLGHSNHPKTTILGPSLSKCPLNPLKLPLWSFKLKQWLTIKICCTNTKTKKKKKIMSSCDIWNDMLSYCNLNYFIRF